MKQKTIAILLFVVLSSFVNAQCKYYNRFDSGGNKTGLWLNYWDKEQSIFHSKFHYKNGREVKVNKIYNREGILVAKERHVKKRIKMKSFDENGKLLRKGWAKIDFNAEDLHFYWHGCWKFYGDKHRLTGISIYEKGFFIKSIENKRTKQNQTKE